MTTSFSRFSPCIAHTKGWVKLKWQHPSLNFFLGWLTKGRVNLEGQHPSLKFTPAFPTRGWVKLKRLHLSLNSTPAWPTKGCVKLEWPLPCLKFTPASSFSKILPLHCPQGWVRLEWPHPSKFSPCIAHKRVSQVGMTTSFSRFSPCIAHTKGCVKLKWQHPSLNFSSGGSPRGASTWKGNFLF